MKETTERTDGGAEYPDALLVDSRTAAEMLGVSLKTLIRWKAQRPAFGPKALRLPSKMVRYRVSDIREFVASLNETDGGKQ